MSINSSLRIQGNNSSQFEQKKWEEKKEEKEFKKEFHGLISGPRCEEFLKSQKESQKKN